MSRCLLKCVTWIEKNFIHCYFIQLEVTLFKKSKAAVHSLLEFMSIHLDPVR